jgi:hypothetical protein
MPDNARPDVLLCTREIRLTSFGEFAALNFAHEATS